MAIAIGSNGVFVLDMYFFFSIYSLKNDMMEWKTEIEMKMVFLFFISYK